MADNKVLLAIVHEYLVRKNKNLATVFKSQHSSVSWCMSQHVVSATVWEIITVNTNFHRKKAF